MGTEGVEVKESHAITDLEQKIIRQVEYYFGNYNLSRDKFLREQLKTDDGWVPLETMILFKRLKSLTEDFKVICEALKKSPNQLMEADEECTKIRRRLEKPLPDDAGGNKDALDEKTLYVKGFRPTNTLDELLEYFKEYKAESIMMRKNKHKKDKPFKGSCFVTFETKEDAEKVLANDEMKYENTELLKEFKKDYIKRKDIQFENIREEKRKKNAEKANKEGSNEHTSKAKANKNSGNKDTFIPGCLIKIVGLSGKCSREDIKEIFDKYGTVVYVDYNRGQTEAIVRFETGVAATALEGIPDEDGEKKINISTDKVTLSLIDGDADKEYWDNIAVSRANSRKNFHRSGGRGSGRFNKFGGKRRNNRDGDDQYSAKKQKTDCSEDQQTKANEESNGVKNESKMEEKE